MVIYGRNEIEMWFHELSNEGTIDKLQSNITQTLKVVKTSKLIKERATIRQ